MSSGQDSTRIEQRVRVRRIEARKNTVPEVAVPAYHFAALFSCAMQKPALFIFPSE